ncbi:MAG: chorismate-binding protein, partial [Elusimicrobiota bacterium]
MAPLVLEVPADTWTPVAAFLRLTRPGEPSFLLESVEGGEHMARYSFLGSGPFETLVVENGSARRIREDGTLVPLPGNPFLALGRRIRDFASAPAPGLPRFCGGAVGTLDYSMVRHLEPTARIPARPGAEARLMLFGNVVAFDHLRHRMLLIANVIREDGSSADSAYRKARRALDAMRERLFRPFPALKPRRPGPRAGAPRFPSGPAAARAFLVGAAGLKRHIRAGDIFQAVLSSRADIPVAAPPFSVYRALRALNPSPYMFFVDYGRETALGASPEMLVRVEGGTVEARPIAGTRPRGGSEEADDRLEKSLLSSVKEKAEHLMLVDLGRNDVGRVSQAGSVRVPSFMKVERYSHVMHL